MYNELEAGKKQIAVVGLGYVGLPLLIALSKHFKVIGFDINEDKISNLKNGLDRNNEVGDNELVSLGCTLTHNIKELKSAHFFIIAVPTPIDKNKDPDLDLVKEATSLVAQNMPSGSIIIYESTVYPGVTENICIPLIEKESGFKNLKDFSVGYSPERINPGDKKHTLENIVKIISAQTEDSLEITDKVYSRIIKAGTYRAKNIKVAEAAKVIENTQRDINVALINELAMIFSKLGIDTKDVLEAAGTKWNFLNFVPGLVGGHCIGIDPYYLTYLARKINYNPEIINAGRKINDSMGHFVGEQILNVLSSCNIPNKNIRIALFGISFKENVADSRNSKVIDIYNYLKKHNIDVFICDPIVNKIEVKEIYGISLIGFEEIKDINASVFCVAHECFKRMDLLQLKSKMVTDNPYIFDIKWIFKKESIEKLGYRYWRL